MKYIVKMLMFDSKAHHSRQILNFPGNMNVDFLKFMNRESLVYHLFCGKRYLNTIEYKYTQKQIQIEKWWSVDE